VFLVVAVHNLTSSSCLDVHVNVKMPVWSWVWWQFYILCWWWWWWCFVTYI